MPNKEQDEVARWSSGRELLEPCGPGSSPGAELLSFSPFHLKGGVFHEIVLGINSDE